MVVIHVKSGNSEGFLYETTCNTTNDQLIRDLVSIIVLLCRRTYYFPNSNSG